MTKAVYMYDDNNQFTNTKLVEDDYQISDNETFIAVPDGQYQPSKFTGTKWVGTDQAVWQAAQEAARKAELAKNPKQPTATDKLLADLMLKQAQQDKINETLLQSAKSE